MLVDLMDFSPEAVGSLACKGGSCRSQELPQAHAHPCFGDEKSQGASAHSAGVLHLADSEPHRLAFDLLIEGRTDRFIEFSFVGINRAISALLNTNEIVVLAELEGRMLGPIDGLGFLPACGPTGYFCRSCLDHFRDTNPGEEFTKFFPSREAVWADDISSRSSGGSTTTLPRPSGWESTGNGGMQPGPD